MAIHLENDEGRAGIALVEVKLSEGGYTHCGGIKSGANRRKDVCASASAFFDDSAACYLRRTRHAQRDRRYWAIFEEAFGSVRAAFPGFSGDRCPFDGDFQQIMRNHALALGLLQADHAAFVAFGLVHHPGNHHVIEPWEAYRSVVADPSPLFRIPADQVVTAAAVLGNDWADWAQYTRSGWDLVEVGVLRYLRTAGQHWNRIDVSGGVKPRLRESVVVLSRGQRS